MFKFLKEKLNSVVKIFSREVEEESEKVEVKTEAKSEVKQEIKHEEKKEEKKETKHELKEKKEEKEKQEKQKRKDNEEQKEKEKKARKEEKETKTHDHKIKKDKTEKSEEETVPEWENPEQKKGLFSKIFKQKEKQEDELEEKQKKAIDITKEDLDKADVKGFETNKESISDLEGSSVKEPEKKKEPEKTGIAILPPMPPPEDKSKDKQEKSQSETLSISEKKGFFTKITETFTKINLSEEKFEELFWNLEVMLLENNVAVDVIKKIKEDLKEELMSNKISRKNVDEIIKDSLKKSIEEILDIKGFDIEDRIKHKKPYVIAVVGVNGSGKTTTIAKLCHMLKKKGYSIVLAAADTFRAAAIQQLEHHAEKLDVKVIKHDYNSDPAAVAFDAIKHAEAKKIDVVVIDTAGRLHSNDNLMNELRKLIKVNKPDLKLFVGESITGNDCIEQAKVYDEIIGIDAIILSKADVDEKGGAALSISYVTKKPVLFIGTGQKYEDLKPFDRKEIMEGLGF